MNNTENAIFNLMQNVIDKLDIINQNIVTRNIDSEKSTISLASSYNKTVKSIHKTIVDLLKLLKDELDLNDKAREEISNKLKEIELTPIINETNNEYSLIGSKSIFNPKQLIGFLILLVVLWSSIKYIPPYLNEKSNIKQKFEDYETLTNYLYLSNNEKTKDYITKAMNKIEKKDSTFMSNYYKIMKTHQIELRKRKLQEELKSLEN